MSAGSLSEPLERLGCKLGASPLADFRSELLSSFKWLRTMSTNAMCLQATCCRASSQTARPETTPKTFHCSCTLAKHTSVLIQGAGQAVRLTIGSPLSALGGTRLLACAPSALLL